DSGGTSTHWVVIMPYAEPSLEKYLEDGSSRLSLTETLDILTDIATTLGDLHGRIVHRDVKTANVLRYRGAWCLTYFGIARYVDAATGTHTKKGIFSNAYAAPELWRGDKVTEATDVYGWGIIAYELVTHELPFLGPTADKFKDQHLHREPPSISIEVPESFAELIQECLDKVPKARPTARELLQRLDQPERSSGPGRAA